MSLSDVGIIVTIIAGLVGIARHFYEVGKREGWWKRRQRRAKQLPDQQLELPLDQPRQ